MNESLYKQSYSDYLSNNSNILSVETKVIFYFNLLSFNMQIHWEIGSPLEPASSGHSRNCNLCHFSVDFIVAAWLELLCTHTTLAEVWRSLNWKSHSHLQKRTFVTSLLALSDLKVLLTIGVGLCLILSMTHPQTSLHPLENSTITVNSFIYKLYCLYLQFFFCMCCLYIW